MEPSDESPLINPPPVVPRLRRTPIGWIFLGLMFGLMIFSALADQQPKTPANDLTSFESEIRMSMRLRELGPFAAAGRESASKIVERLRPKAKSSRQAKRLLLVSAYEAKGSISKEDLALLDQIHPKEDRLFAGQFFSALNLGIEPDYPADRAMAELYRSEKLTPERAASLSKELGDDFVGRVAAVHAADKAGNDAPRAAFSPVGKTILLLLLLTTFMGAGLCGLVGWAVYLGMRSSGRWKPLGHPAEPLSLPEADRFALRASLLMAAFLVMGVLASGLTRDQPQPVRWFASGASLLLLLPFIHWLPVFGVNISARRIGVTSQHWLRDIALGIAGWCATVPLIVIFGLIGAAIAKALNQEPTHPAVELLKGGQSTMGVLALLFSASIAAPIWEEIMFRGTLLPALSRLLGKAWLGIVASSLLFAAIHPQGIALWLGLGSIGAMGCLLAYQTKSLIPAIVLHAVSNAAILGLNLLMN